MSEGKGGGEGCSLFLEPSPLPGPPATPKDVCKEPTAGNGIAESILMPPTTHSGAGTASKPPLKASPSSSKSKLSSPPDGFGDVEDDGGGGIAFTLGSSESGEFGHNAPPRAAARLTRLCVR